MKQQNREPAKAPANRKPIPVASGIPYDLMYVNSAEILVPIEDYQRELKMSEVTDIVNDFNEDIANEPKLAFYDGHYYVFDGQHTIAARLVRNHNKPLDILCKVYYDLTRQQAAALFAKQTGYSRRLTPGQKIRADIFSGEKNVTDFNDATAAIGLRLSYSDTPGLFRIRCISTALKMYNTVGRECYQSALRLICESWDGIPESLLREVIVTVCRFERLYSGEYDRTVMARALSEVSPYKIVDATFTLDSYKGIKNGMKYMLDLYNAKCSVKPLPAKF